MTHFVVVLPLSPLTAGESFTVAGWPLHVTLVEPFAADRPHEVVAAALHGVARDARPITTTAGDPALFGRRHDVPVTLIRDGGEIAVLRTKALAALDAAEVGIGPPRNDFRPHVTVKRHGAVNPGDRVVLRQLALVDMQPSSGAHHRSVIGVWPLGEASVSDSVRPATHG
jgi:2'-5' RNA ligase